MDKIRLSNYILAFGNLMLLAFIVISKQKHSTKGIIPSDSPIRNIQNTSLPRKTQWMQAYEKFKSHESGLKNARPVKNRQLLLVGSKISDDALISAGISLNEKNYISELVKFTTDEMSVLIKSKIEETSTEQGFYSYKIPLIPEGQLLLDQLKGKLQKKYGLDSANSLFSGFDTKSYLGNFGRLEVQMDLVVDPNDTNLYRVRYKTIDPKFSKIKTNDVMTLDNFNKVYGKLFELH